MLIGIERDAIVMSQRQQLAPNPDQTRGICIGIAAKLQFEKTCAGIFPEIRDAALALDPVVEADGVPDRNTLQARATAEEL